MGTNNLSHSKGFFSMIKEAFPAQRAKGKLEDASYYTRRWLCQIWVAPSLQPSVPSRAGQIYSDTGFPPYKHSYTSAAGAGYVWTCTRISSVVSEHDDRGRRLTSVRLLRGQRSCPATPPPNSYSWGKYRDTPRFKPSFTCCWVISHVTMKIKLRRRSL